MDSQRSAFISQRGHSEVMIATAVLQLAEKGLLHLDELVSSYLSAEDLASFGYTGGETEWCPTLSGQSGCLRISLRHLLSMSSGLRDGSTCHDSDADHCVTPAIDHTTQGHTLSSLISTFIRNPIAEVPGSGFLYAHENYVLLAYLVEKTAGQTLREYLHSNIFYKLNMDCTLFNAGTDALSLFKRPASYVEYASAATGPMDMVAEGSCHSLEDAVSRRSVGELVTTVPDLVRFYASLFVAENASGILSAESRAAMLKSTGEMPSEQCLLGAEAEHLCQYGLGVKLLFHAARPTELLAYGSDTQREACFWSAVSVYDDSTAVTRPLVAAAFTNNRVVHVSRPQWMAVMSGQSSECLACRSPIDADDGTHTMVQKYAQQDTTQGAATDETDDIGDRELSVGQMVAVVVVPVFVVTVVWLLIVTDYHRKKVFRAPVDQAERIKRAQDSLRAEGIEVPMDGEESPVENPLTSNHGNV